MTISGDLPGVTDGEVLVNDFGQYEFNDRLTLCFRMK